MLYDVQKCSLYGKLYDSRPTDFEPAVWAEGEESRKIWRLCPFGLAGVSCSFTAKHCSAAERLKGSLNERLKE
jgi:hypothetical protein